PAGFGTTFFSVPATYSASAPRSAPNTSSPGRSWVTFLPTASTIPATSAPRTLLLGLRIPTTGRRRYGLPSSMPQSMGLIDAARRGSNAECERDQDARQPRARAGPWMPSDQTSQPIVGGFA